MSANTNGLGALTRSMTCGATKYTSKATSWQTGVGSLPCRSGIRNDQKESRAKRLTLSDLEYETAPSLSVRNRLAHLPFFTSNWTQSERGTEGWGRSCFPKVEVSDLASL